MPRIRARRVLYNKAVEVAPAPASGALSGKNAKRAACVPVRRRISYGVRCLIGCAMGFTSLSMDWAILQVTEPRRL